jgi:sulfide:quinone oxidoreductase
VEIGGGKVGRVDVNFLGGPSPTGTYRAPVEEMVAEKLHFGTSRVERWFGSDT